MLKLLVQNIYLVPPFMLLKSHESLSRHSWLYFVNVYFFLWRCGPTGPGPSHSWGFWMTLNDAPQSVGLLWKSDQLVAETSTWQHTTLPVDEHPRPQRDPNSQSQQASGRRPTP